MDTHAILAFGPPEPATPVVCLQWHTGDPGLGVFLQAARTRHVNFRRGDTSSACTARDCFAAIARVLLVSGRLTKGLLANVDADEFDHRLYVLDEHLRIVACEAFDAASEPAAVTAQQTPASPRACDAARGCVSGPTG